MMRAWKDTAWERGIGKAQTYHIVIMCRFPEEMKLGSIGTTGEGRDIKVEKERTQIFA